MEEKQIEEFRNGFLSILDLVDYYGSIEKTLERLEYFGIDLLDYDIAELKTIGY